jgi:hypothetical protein
MQMKYKEGTHGDGELSRQHEPWCDMMESAGTGTLDNECTCDPLKNAQLAHEWYEKWRIANINQHMLARYIFLAGQGLLGHSCGQCVPEEPLVKQGLICTYHLALKIENDAKELTPVQRFHLYGKHD